MTSIEYYPYQSNEWAVILFNKLAVILLEFKSKVHKALVVQQFALLMFC